MRASVISRFANFVTVGAEGRAASSWAPRLAVSVPLAAIVAVGAVGCSDPKADNAAAKPSATPSVSASAVPSAVPSTVPSAAPTSAAPSTPAPAPSTATPTPPAPTTLAPTTPAQAPAARRSTAPAAPVNTHGSLTVSNGTGSVWIDGRWTGFGSPVRDLAWSPDGSQAAFVDGVGDLIVTGPNGQGRMAARNPGGQTWSHPTWQVAAADPRDQLPAKNNIIFTVAEGGTTRLVKVPATAHEGTPTVLPLGGYSDPDQPPMPQTGNTWANAAGGQGRAVYANSGDGQVYLRDDNLREQGGALTKGSEPALSHDAESVVFVRSVDGHDHLFVERVYGKTAPKDLTPHATTDYTEPAWSPDGAVIAARTPAGIVIVHADGSGTPALATTVTGLPAYRG
ncbi:PD40 domain-containing protein [Kitasatospora azatica]|uniref:PD40 domain-containing protein n=1 Tax=Kitasatospora azatica TaxID=58347 RepID=UPI00055ED921|nr:PD40 domain-containing protein [Kitasatospora azatica]